MSILPRYAVLQHLQDAVGPCSRTEKKKEEPLSHTPPCTILATNLLHLAYLLAGRTVGGQRYGGGWLWSEM